MSTRHGLARLLPPQVEVEETMSDVSESTMLPAEAAAVASAVPKRRAEFATVRHCARRALVRLGYAPSPILPGAHREPVWPEGVVGSLTHCAGYRAAAVARATTLASLGIDAEVNEPLPEGVVDIVTTAGEPHMLALLTESDPAVAWDRVLFSAKESIYKTWYPLCRTWLDFTECELSIHLGDGTFDGRLLVPGPLVAGQRIDRFAGRWAVERRHILTAVYQSY